jgi:hypothetical protein
MVIGTDETRNKIYCAGEDQQQVNRLTYEYSQPWNPQNLRICYVGPPSLRHGAPSCGVDRADSLQMCSVAGNMFNGEFFLLRYNAL